MSDIFNKIKFAWRRPKVVIVAGRGGQTAREAIYQVLSRHFRLGKEILLFESGLVDIKYPQFLIKKSSLPLLVATHAGEYHPEKEFFAASLDQVSTAAKLSESLPAKAHLILNFDDETVRDIKNKTAAHVLTFGFGARADMKVSDVVLTDEPGAGTNFKINFEGNIVPVWLDKLFGKEHIYAALAAAAVGEALGLNLVEISEALRFYKF